MDSRNDRESDCHTFDGNKPRSRIKKGLILQYMTPQEKENLKQQYLVWTQQSIKELQKNATNNLTERIPIMLEVANNKLVDINDDKLEITETYINDIINKVHYEISLWNGIEIGSCKTEKDDFTDYSNTARNWFNRNKAKFYGNHLFYPIIFGIIYEFVMDISRITDNEKIVLFVNILVGILHSTVQFHRSKTHPLIPHQSFIQKNLFRKACCDLCRYYEVKWDLCLKKQKRQQLPNGQYAKNRQRSRNVNDAFIRKIDEIKQNVLYKNITKSMPIFPNHYSMNYGYLLSSRDGDIDGDDEKQNKTMSENHYKYKTIKTEIDQDILSDDGDCDTMPGSDDQYNNKYNKYKYNKDNKKNNECNTNTMSCSNLTDEILLNSLSESLMRTPLNNLNNNTNTLNNSNVLTSVQNINGINNLQSNTSIHNNVSTDFVPLNMMNYNNMNIISPQTEIVYISPINHRNSNCFNYTANRGQNCMVSQSRYSPLLSSHILSSLLSIPNINMNIHPNINGTVSISLQNVAQSQNYGTGSNPFCSNLFNV